MRKTKDCIFCAVGENEKLLGMLIRIGGTVVSHLALSDTPMEMLVKHFFPSLAMRSQSLDKCFAHQGRICLGYVRLTYTLKPSNRRNHKLPAPRSPEQTATDRYTS
ncbi:hypothetical protein PoB_006500400 [Plakobranchus ocellatus]|uniref:Uncharacterized protein n=1 Tax=Plakobranchus ocellatus TaxID=259542 RepID=A0AAV4D2T7_9GAST|nr:hypothetical protein PoB_006500400 [Plakobranchus ocellatus]